MAETEPRCPVTLCLGVWPRNVTVDTSG
jgi:hypothetical protein